MKLSIVKFFDTINETAVTGFDDVIIPVYNSLLRLGHNVSYRENSLSAGDCNIIFGAHMHIGRLEDICDTDIIVNLEQWHDKSRLFTPDYLDLLRRARVFDYSKRNAKYLLREQGIKTEFFRIGYDPLQTVLDPDFPKDIDVLFYGAINQRRKKLLQILSKRGFRVVTMGGIFGRERDHFIARSKLVLNIQYYEDSSLEIVRLSYLLSNRKAVVSERSLKTYIYPELEEACKFSRYEELPETVEALLADERELRRTAEAGFEAFSKWKMDDTLRELIGPAAHSVGASFCPTKLNAGSGKDFKIDYLNVDISSQWNPDIVFDLGCPVDYERIFNTARFGPIKLREGSFDRIVANDVLEHVSDLLRIMTNFLALLKEGGELHIQVPYDLSYGAWQDPTHVRAFNEKSWLYYTEWAWYSGWQTHCFDMVSLELCSAPDNPLRELMANPINKFRPRVIDSMSVILRKRRTTDEERMAYSMHHGQIYLHNRT